MRDHLIRRDTPIPKGTTIELRVVSTYEITLDDDLLVDGESEATLAQIADWFGHYESEIIRDVKRSYDAVVEEADWFLPNRLPEDYREFRFERNGEGRWARKERYVELADVLPKEVTR